MGHTNGFSYYIAEGTNISELTDHRTVTLQFGQDLAIVELRMPAEGERAWQGSATRALAEDVAEMLADWDGMTDDPGWVASGQERNGEKEDRVHFVIRAAFRWSGEDATHERTVKAISRLMDEGWSGSEPETCVAILDKIAEVLQRTKHATDDASLDDVRKRVAQVLDRYCITRPDREDMISDILGVVPPPSNPKGYEYSGPTGDIYADVMAAMQNAEEAGGPEQAEYVALMDRIAAEATARANRVRPLKTSRAVIEIVVAGNPEDAALVVNQVLDSGVLQDAINDHTFDAGEIAVASAVVKSVTEVK